MRRAVVTAILAVAIALLLGPLSQPAEAGGSWLYPVQDRYEPGQDVTLVGYSGSGAFGLLSDGPFYAYLFRMTEDGAIPERAIPLPVGELAMSSVKVDYSASSTRSAITFQLPDYVEPGMYFLDYCNRACDQRLGDLVGAHFAVGIDPEYPVVRSWPEGEPELANLADDALVWVAGSSEPRPMSEVRELHQQAQLAGNYRDCVLAAGIDLGVGAQVLVNAQGIPWHVKTALEVPGAVHGPCFQAIGGAETAGSSWSISTGCRVPTAANFYCDD